MRRGSTSCVKREEQMKADEVKGESQKEKEVRETRLKMREAMIVKSFINYHHSFRTLYT